MAISAVEFRRVNVNVTATGTTATANLISRDLHATLNVKVVFGNVMFKSKFCMLKNGPYLSFVISMGACRGSVLVRCSVRYTGRINFYIDIHLLRPVGTANWMVVVLCGIFMKIR